MVNRPKQIGTAAESAVVRYLRANGFPHAERRALTGSSDQGDVTGIPGLVVEIKGGQAAKNASDGQVALWLEETERERTNAHADIGVLILARAGIGTANAGRWWAITELRNLTGAVDSAAPIRMHLDTMVDLWRRAGYGDPL